MNESKHPGLKLFHWVDAMKTMGMFFIIYGHLFSYGYPYVYAFNVPVFFILSGFLFKEGQPASVFWHKVWWQLVVPMLAISVLNNTYLIVNDWLHHRLDSSRFLFPVGLLTGQHRFLEVCWFIYTLVLLKVISFYIHGNGFRVLLAVVFLVAAYMLAPVIRLHDWRNAALCVLLAYPFFVMGHLVKAGGFAQRALPWWACVIGMILSFAALSFIVRVNVDVFLYRFIFGNDLVLCLLGGLAGTTTLFFVSKLLDFPAGWIRTLAVGSVVTLGFHRYLIVFYRHFFDKNPFDFLVAFIILLIFIPVIRFCIRHVPWLVGNRK